MIARSGFDNATDDHGSQCGHTANKARQPVGGAEDQPGRAWIRYPFGLVIALLLAVVGCSDDEDDPAPVSVSSDRPSCNQVPRCDIRTADCQAQVFEVTSCERVQNGATRPPVFTVDEDEAFDVLQKLEMSERDVEQDADVARFEHGWAMGLALLGLAQPPSPSGGVDVSRELLKDIAAFYVPSTKEVYVIDRGQAPEVEDSILVLAHEFVHALQDQAEDLQAFREQYVSSSDSHLAVTAIIEGEATVLSTAILYRLLGNRPLKANWQRLGQRYIDNAFTSALDSAAPFYSLFQGLPYGLGVQLVSEGWVTQGQPGVDAIFDDPPTSLGGWPTPNSSNEDAALRCLPVSAPDGYQAVSADRLGPAGSAAAALFQGEEASNSWVFDWRDDRVVLFLPRSGSSATDDSVAIAWRVRLADENIAADFAQDVIGTAPWKAMTVVVERDEVLVYGSDDAEVMSRWRPVECGSVEAFADLFSAPAMAAQHLDLSGGRAPGRLHRWLHRR